MKSLIPLALSTALALSAVACSKTDSTPEMADTIPDATEKQTAMETALAENNPFFKESPLFFHYPQFDKIGMADYQPAFERGMADQLVEIDAIANQQEAATIDNTLIPMERSGQLLTRVATVFFSMAAADTNDEIEALRSEMAPKLSAHNDKILLNDKLFARVQALYEQRESLELDPESYRLVEEKYKEFVRAGAKLSAQEKDRLKAMNSELATLQTTFSQNVLNEVNASAVVVDNSDDLAGMTQTRIDAAAAAAKDKEMEGKLFEVRSAGK